MADKYLELIDGVITEREVITKSLGYDDAGKIPGLGDDGRLDIFMMSKDVVTTLNPADHGFLLGLADDDHTQYLLADGTRAANEIRLTPKASSSGPEGTIFYDSDDDHVWVGTE